MITINSKYLLNFIIPQGPTGPAGGILAYGGIYSNDDTHVDLPISGDPVQIELESTMPSSNISYSTSNCITILVAGVYEISYHANVSTTAATITLNLRNNGQDIPETAITRTITQYTFNGSIIMSLGANSTLDMVVSSTLGVDINLNGANNASIIVKKLG